jgi:CspA family cold shock protein
VLPAKECQDVRASDLMRSFAVISNSCINSYCQQKRFFMSNMLTGTVKWFDAVKGYGFLQQPNGNDVFVHISALERAGIDKLTEGQQVRYEIVSNKGRSSAGSLELVN